MKLDTFYNKDNMAGLKELEDNSIDCMVTDPPYDVQKTFPWLIVPKASSSEKNDGLDGKLTAAHPTVKPLKLISYIITLGSRSGDIILDPYGGSGTTGIAAYRLERRFILFESEPEYHEIAEAKLKNEKRKSNKTLFDFVQ